MLFLHATEVASEWTTGDTLQLILGILLFISAIFLVVVVLMQTGKDKGVGAIAGGSSETYFGKNKGKSRDKKLALVTTIVAIVFVVMALVSFIIQPYYDLEEELQNQTTTPTTGSTGASGTTGSTDASGTTSSSTDASAGTTDTSASTTDTSANTPNQDNATPDQTTNS